MRAIDVLHGEVRVLCYLDFVFFFLIFIYLIFIVEVVLLPWSRARLVLCWMLDLVSEVSMVSVDQHISFLFFRLLFQ